MKSFTSQKAIIIIITLLFIGVSSFAQRSFDTYKGGFIWKHYYVKGNVGFNMFYGDVSSHDQDIFKKIGQESSFAYSLSAGKWVTDWGGAEATFSMGKIKGSTSSYEFTNDYNQYIFQGIINLMQLIYPAENQTPFYLYLKAGYGFINFNSVLLNSKTLDTVKIVGKNSAYGKRVTEWLIPLGIGGGFNIDENFAIIIDGNLHLVNSDKLDTKYGNSGNDDNDFYVNFSIGMKYTFNIKNTYGKFKRSKSRRTIRYR